ARPVHGRWNALAVLVDDGEHRRGVEVAVVDIVMRGLKVPLVLCGRRVERDDAGGIQVRTGSAVAVVLIDGIAERDEDQSGFLIDAQRLPRAGTFAILPAVQ